MVAPLMLQMELATALLIMGGIVAAGAMYLLVLRLAQWVCGRIRKDTAILPANSSMGSKDLAAVPAERLEASESPQGSDLTLCIATAPTSMAQVASRPIELPLLFLIGAALIALGLGQKLQSSSAVPASRRPLTLDRRP